MGLFLNAVRRLWPLKHPPAKQAPLPPVVVHDPAADRPHDLDDPFFDPAVQERIGKMISETARKK